MEVFRRTYEAIELGWVFKITKIPFIGKIADYIYDVWAENRLIITGRKDLVEIMKEKNKRLNDVNLKFTQDSDCDKCQLN